MNPCKTLIRTSLSCLEIRARPAGIRHFSSRLSLHSGLKFKTHMPFSLSRKFSSAVAAVPLEASSDCAEEEVTKIEYSNSPIKSCKGTVAELLLSKHKYDISRLIKMERRPDNVDGFSDERWFPYLDKFRAEVDLNSGEVLEAMEPYINDVRKEKFRNTVNNRSYSVCLVVEGLNDFGNVSAAFRSADALGLQSVHVVAPNHSKRYKDNRHVSMGAEKWLDIELWNSAEVCFGILKSRGYRIATAHLGTDAVSIYDIDWSCPTAIVVGNEGRGISSEALELSDLHCSIPMGGMVDSFNVSVAAGILMHHAVRDRINRVGHHGDLTPQERQILLAEFYLRHSDSATRVANEFSKRKLREHVSKL